MHDNMTRSTISTRITTSDLAYCGMFTALMVIGAYIKIMLPIGIWEVTFSLQFFFALMAGFILGPAKGLLSVIVYLLLGLCGFPVFAHGGGPAYLLKPTFGFLIGFATAAWFSGMLSHLLKKNSFPRLLLAGFVGEMSYYFAGLVYYFIMFNYVLSDGSTRIGLIELFSVWFLSTVFPDFVLCFFASLLATRLLPHLKRLGQNF